MSCDRFLDRLDSFSSNEITFDAFVRNLRDDDGFGSGSIGASRDRLLALFETSDETAAVMETNRLADDCQDLLDRQ